MEALGEPGERWLNAWRHDPDVAYNRVLNDTVTMEEIRTPVLTRQSAESEATHERSRSKGRRGNGRTTATRRSVWRPRHVEHRELCEARTYWEVHDPDWLAVRDSKLQRMKPDDTYSRASVEEAIVKRYREATSPDPGEREQARIDAIVDHKDPNASNESRLSSSAATLTRICKKSG